jgi:two-component system cell cycle sensor histidine kinase/response regulator CckA
LLVASLIPLGFAAILDIREARQRLIGNASALLGARADQLAREIDAFNFTYRSAALVFCKVPTLLEYARTKDPQHRLAVEGLLAALPKNNPEVWGVALLDPTGRVLVSSESKLQGKDLGSRAHVRDVLSGSQELVISDVYLETFAGDLATVAYLAPVRGAGGALLGATAVWVRAAALWQLLRESDALVGPGSFAVLLDRYGVRQAHTLSDEVLFHPAGPLDAAAVKSMAAEQRFGPNTESVLAQTSSFPEQFERARAAAIDPGTFRGIGWVTKEWSYGVARRFHGVSWTVFYMAPEQPLLDQVARLTQRKVLFAAGIILLALLAGAWLARSILGPIASLSAATDRLAAGNLDARVDFRQEDEIGKLAASFDAMADRLQAQSRALVDANERLELRVRERTAELSTTLDSIGDGVIATDTEGCIVRINPVAERLTGWAEEEALGRRLEEVFRVINEETGLAVESPVTRVLREGTVVGLADQSVLVARDGTSRAVADSGAPIRDEQGALRGTVLVFRDQTEQRRGERLLKESEARKGAILEAALDCIVTIDQNGIVREFNPAAEKTFGYPRSEAVGQTLQELLIPPSLRSAHNRAFAHYLATGEGPILGKRVEIKAMRKGGEEFPVELAVVPIRAGGALGFTAYIRDLTDRQQAAEALKLSEQSRKETEEQLRQAQKMEAVGTLAGGIAHDFNNLLSVILSYGDLLLEDLKPSDPMRDDLEQIIRAGRRAHDLTRQMLAFSRQQVLQPRVVDINRTVGATTRMLKRLIGEDIELSLNTAAVSPNVFVDPGQIEQVLMNLVLNARDAMPQGGKLTIETGNLTFDDRYASEHLGVSPGRHIMLSVTDTGFGMDANVRSRIFEPFFTTKEKGKGTGLGLSTVFGIVKQSGGSIWVYSEPGQGTAFKIYLPEVDASKTPISIEASEAARQRGTETVLLVEDDPQVRTLTLTILRRHGYQVLQAASGDEALAQSERHQGAIQLLLTDVIMPRMSGRELAERIAKLRPDTRILFMSGYTDDAIVHHGVLSSEMSFVQKPILPGPLLAKIREVLDRRG